MLEAFRQRSSEVIAKRLEKAQTYATRLRETLTSDGAKDFYVRAVPPLIYTVPEAYLCAEASKIYGFEGGLLTAALVTTINFFWVGGVGPGLVKRLNIT